MYQNTLKLAVCDDRPEDRQILSELLSRYLDEREILARVESFESGEAFLAGDTAAFALVFLDIYMKEIDGLDTAVRLLKRNPHTQVIFCSTSREHAVEAYQLDALNYLVKPLDYQSVSRVLDKFFLFVSGIRTISVKVGRLTEDVYLDDLIWIEAQGKQAVLYTVNGCMRVSNSVSELQELLSEKEFYRPIRWAVISLKQVQSLNADRFVMCGGKEIPISRMERERAKQIYAEYRWKRMRQSL